MDKEIRSNTELIAIIKAKRLEMGYSSEQIAGYLGMSKTNYCTIEKGTTKLRIDKLLLICDKLLIKITLEY